MHGVDWSEHLLVGLELASELEVPSLVRFSLEDVGTSELEGLCCNCLFCLQMFKKLSTPPHPLKNLLNPLSSQLNPFKDSNLAFFNTENFN